MVYRSSYYASAYGGVSFAYADYDSAYVVAYIGSRLAININVCLKIILAYNDGDVSPMSCQWE